MNDINGVIGYRRVNPENLDEMATWCGGVVRPTTEEPQRLYVQVNELDIAFPGDWIINTKDGFKSMSDEELKDLEKDKSRYTEVLAIVKQAMLAQDVATYGGDSTSGMDTVAQTATQKILEIME